MSYKTGFCPCCNCQVMAQGTNGRWDSFKPTFRQADIHFENGQRVRTIICEECLSSPDMTKLMEAITCKKSEVHDDSIKDKIKSLGVPVKVQLAERARQGVRLGV